jgi:hypothetical protein
LEGENLSQLEQTGTGGILVLEQTDGKALRGHSLVTARLNPEATGADYTVQASPLTGELTRLADRTNQLSFTVQGQNGVKVYTNASLSDNGKTMHGTSRAIVPNASQTITYTWVAKKIA